MAAGSWRARSQQRGADVRLAGAAAASRKSSVRCRGRRAGALLDVPFGLAGREVPEARAAGVVAAATAAAVTGRQRVLRRPTAQRRTRKIAA